VLEYPITKVGRYALGARGLVQVPCAHEPQEGLPPTSIALSGALLFAGPPRLVASNRLVRVCISPICKLCVPGNPIVGSAESHPLTAGPILLPAKHLRTKREVLYYILWASLEQYRNGSGEAASVGGASPLTHRLQKQRAPVPGTAGARRRKQPKGGSITPTSSSPHDFRTAA
jgi:hypothetical protein